MHPFFFFFLFEFQEMENFGGLNSDIPFDVLSRLSAKELVGFKSVSKGWQHLISDRSFIRVQSQKKEPLSGFFCQQRYRWSYDDIKTISYIPVGREGAELRQNVFDFLPQDVVVLTSCNGLVCCRSCVPFEEPTIYVCNPLNKEWNRMDWARPDKEDSIALAFDPFQDFTENSTNFKVVRVLQFGDDQKEVYFAFDVYSSKTRKWKLSKEICWCSSNLYKNKGVFIGGVLHWLTDGDKILTFNVENELAWLISAPIPATEFNSVPEACIGESKGRLHYIMISEEGLHVWFLEDYFDFKWSLKHSKTLAEMEKEHAQSFCNLYERVTQRLTFDNSPWMDPLAFKDRVLLLRVSNTIYLYHIETSKMEKFCENSRFGTNSLFCPTVVPYSMSLVPF